MGKGKRTKQTAEISTTNTPATAGQRLKRHRRTKSKIAAYIEGKIKLSGIMHPSRLTVIDKKPHFNCDVVNEYTAIRKLKSEIKCRRLPPLKDYIDGKVPVSLMLPPGKMNEIPSKTKHLQSYQKRYFTSEIEPKARWNYHHNETAFVKNVKKPTSLKKCGKENDNDEKLKKTPTRSHLPSLEASAKTSCSAADSVETGRGDDNDQNDEIGDVQRILNLDSAHLRDIDHLDGLLSEIQLGEETNVDDLLMKSCSKNSYSSKSTVSMFDRTPRTASVHSLESDCIETSSELSSYVRCTRALHQNRIIEAHQEIEKHLLSQIVHLRKSRDKYKRCFKDIKNLVRILAQRSFSFRILNID